MSKHPDTTGARSPYERGRGPADQPAWVAKQLRWGWTSLLVFLSLGIVLETLHGFKIGWYLTDGEGTRRLMWTLAHAHGTLLSLVQIAFCLSVPFLAAGELRSPQIAGRCLTAATILLPGGFFLGGLNTYGADPGLGIILAPIGGFVLLAGVAAIVQSLRA